MSATEGGYTNRLACALTGDDANSFVEAFFELLARSVRTADDVETWKIDPAIDAALCVATSGGTDLASRNEGVRVLRAALALLEATGAGGD